jgi:alkanesulfonate monooxygenase SsuD/methylene tetrahydromethanopterin reductase-like flavin-dependent oxidoreductase (luciferase family)
VLLAAARDYALVGSVEEISERIEALNAVGVDTIVGYPAQGIEAWL